MLYYLLNINVSKDVGTSQVDEWIQNKKIAPIFYGLTTIDEIRNGTARLNSKPLPPDAKLFVDTFFNNINKNAIVFSIGEENIYFYKQEGALKQYEEIEVKTKNCIWFHTLEKADANTYKTLLRKFNKAIQMETNKIKGTHKWDFVIVTLQNKELYTFSTTISNTSNFQFDSINGFKKESL